MISTGLGGVLPEYADPTVFRRVLDIGSGSGSWVIDAAQAYPTMSLVGIDIDERLIDFARQEAKTLQVSDRVEFQTMDALLQLAFPDAAFDLVNLRLGASFIRTWEWPNVLREMTRVTRPKGVVRLTEVEVIHQSSSPALLQVGKMLTCAFFQSGHLFEQVATGIAAHLARLLRGFGCQQVQSKNSTLESRAGTVEDRRCTKIWSIHFKRCVHSSKNGAVMMPEHIIHSVNRPLMKCDSPVLIRPGTSSPPGETDHDAMKAFESFYTLKPDSPTPSMLTAKDACLDLNSRWWKKTPNNLASVSVMFNINLLSI
jgi:ubiquinone/menaquinone biosynthesis C-methylase UbiE